MDIGLPGNPEITLVLKSSEGGYVAVEDLASP